MLIFIDESGDTGLKLTQGSSAYFVLAFLVFNENINAEECDGAIADFRNKLGWKDNQEFHFKKNSDFIRNKLLLIVSTCSFDYYVVVIDKAKLVRLHGYLGVGQDFYQLACSLAAKELLGIFKDAVVVLDGQEKPEFLESIKRSLKSGKDKKFFIKKIKMQDSRKNNLLQLADYIAGVINRSISDKKKDAGKHRGIIKKHEKMIIIWPK